MSKLPAEYEKILDQIPEDKKIIGKKLIAELVFMEKTLKALKEQITLEGTAEHFINGKQNFYRESPSLKSYNTTVQRYSVMYRQLTDLIGKSPELQSNNAIYDFIAESM